MYHRTCETENPIETTENLQTDLTVALTITTTDPSVVTTASGTNGNSETTVLTIEDLAQIETMTVVLIGETQAAQTRVAVTGRLAWEEI
jgi:hypothetical protein